MNPGHGDSFRNDILRDVRSLKGSIIGILPELPKLLQRLDLLDSKIERHTSLQKPLLLDSSTQTIDSNAMVHQHSANGTTLGIQVEHDAAVVDEPILDVAGYCVKVEDMYTSGISTSSQSGFLSVNPQSFQNTSEANLVVENGNGLSSAEISLEPEILNVSASRQKSPRETASSLGSAHCASQPSTSFISHQTPRGPEHGGTGGSASMMCSLCFTVCGSYTALRRHITVVHSNRRPFLCPECGKSFKERGSLTSHRRIHTGERRYSCNVCGIRFTHCMQLVRHRRKEHGFIK